MIKVAIVGCGGIGKFHSTVYTLLPEAQVIAVADIRPEHAEKAAQPHGATVYTSMDDLFASEKPDVVDICTPTYLHADMAVRAMRQGYHVLCEKPLALQRKQALGVVTAAQRSGVIFMVAQVIRFWDEYAFLKKCLLEKTYGALKQAWFSRTGSAPMWSWDGWFLDEKRSGLAPFDLHIHDSDFIYYLLGKPQGVRSAWISEPGKPELSYLRTEYQYAGLGPVGAEGGWFPAPVPFVAAYRVVFENAVLDYRSDGRLMCYPQGAEPYPVPVGEAIKAPSSINIDSIRPYYNEIRYFLECVATGTKPSVVTPQESLASLEMLLAEVRSARTGKTVRLA
jgi:predicted dehydrogenase